jgi:hypothetical protein
LENLKSKGVVISFDGKKKNSAYQAIPFLAGLYMNLSVLLYANQKSDHINFSINR